MKHFFYSLLFLLIGPNLVAQTQTMKVMSGVQNEEGFKLVVAEMNPKSKLLDVVKVMEIKKYGNHEHFKIPKTNRVFVIAIPISENVEEGKEIPKLISGSSDSWSRKHALIQLNHYPKLRWRFSLYAYQCSLGTLRLRLLSGTILFRLKKRLPNQ